MCDCKLSHAITFCTNQICNSVRKCMRYGGNHELNGDRNSFSDFCSEGKYFEECGMYIKAEKEK